MMGNKLAFFREQILSLNFQLISSEIAMDDYRKRVRSLLRDMGWQKSIQLDNLTFS
ncbi:hypothetical protein [Sideroxydans lithotrophicus]|uniref:SMC ATPase superfamily chromosome segregation protein n=1 Tax=Sideroxydans lithotrophicus (strain ES-1) TaxID=580332 RepID=D5CPH2_SIDLE|nr:hypothetical protein [Sideroxydans lithotrophicus]ADE11113.1 SMC ATPase superfamily chromosome segregation protein [Sideroxydans lithotrophicus ES-1]